MEKHDKKFNAADNGKDSYEDDSLSSSSGFLREKIKYKNETFSKIRKITLIYSVVIILLYGVLPSFLNHFGLGAEAAIFESTLCFSIIPLIPMFIYMRGYKFSTLDLKEIKIGKIYTFNAFTGFIYCIAAMSGFISFLLGHHPLWLYLVFIIIFLGFYIPGIIILWIIK